MIYFIAKNLNTLVKSLSKNKNLLYLSCKIEKQHFEGTYQSLLPFTT